MYSVLQVILCGEEFWPSVARNSGDVFCVASYSVWRGILGNVKKGGKVIKKQTGDPKYLITRTERSLILSHT